MGVHIYRPQLGGEELHRQIVEALGYHGSHICHVAAHSHETGRKTGAQENAYGYGIYYNGNLEDWNPCFSVRPQDEDNEGRWGREELAKFFNEYHPQLAGYTLVVVNAMWYSVLQEEGHMAPRKADLVTKSGRIKARKGQTQYRIISQTYGMMKTAMKDIAKRFSLPQGWSNHYTIWHWTRESQL